MHFVAIGFPSTLEDFHQFFADRLNPTLKNCEMPGFDSSSASFDAQRIIV
jgi:hypothetical protein